MKPAIPNPQELSRPKIGAEYFLPEALELIKKVQHKSELTEDEVVMLALTAAQASLAAYVEPGHRQAEETLETIMTLLDHDDVVNATQHKIRQLLKPSQVPPPVT